MGFDPLHPPQLSRADRAVAGCSCGGLQWHALDCTLWELEPGQRQQAVGDAEAVVKRHGEVLNQMLAAWQESLHG